jgi:LmbE family N-acetylglucosaminyl deacetylase
VNPLPEWDRASGFSPGDYVVAVRRREDRAALDRLSASPRHLAFWDDVYRTTTHGYTGPSESALPEAIAHDLNRVIENELVDTWLVPLGFHEMSAHALTTFACLLVASKRSAYRWFVYEELPYRVEEPNELEAAKERFRSRGFLLKPATLSTTSDTTAKREAISLYASQMRVLPKERVEAAIRGPETFHLISAID